MSKIKKYILTETGEVRPPMYQEYYLYNGNPKMAECDYENPYPILKLEIIEEEWVPKDKEQYFHIDALIDQVCEDIWENNGWNRKVYKLGNCFRTKEEAEAMLIKIKEVLND